MLLLKIHNLMFYANIHKQKTPRYAHNVVLWRSFTMISR